MQLTYGKLDYARIARDSHVAIREFIQWICLKEDIVDGLGAIEGESNKYKDDPMLLRQVMGQIVPFMIQNDPRKLYEFFDDHNIRISICEHPDSVDENPSFTYHNSVTKVSQVTNNRHEAEQNAFYDAFKILNTKMINNEPANTSNTPSSSTVEQPPREGL